MPHDRNYHRRGRFDSNQGMCSQATLASITKAQNGAAVTEVSLLNFVVSDGSTLVATRFVSHEDEEAASLYYAEGSAFQVGRFPAVHAF